MLLAMDTSQDNLNNKGTNCIFSFGPYIILRNNAQKTNQVSKQKLGVVQV